MKHVTIKDIARSLCISVSTVSRALTDDKNIPVSYTHLTLPTNREV